MRIQFRRHVDEQARVMRILRQDLQETRAHAAQLAADVTRAKQRADQADHRADLAEAEATTAREALTGGHRTLLAENQRLRTANRALHQQVNNAMGYGPAELAVIDADGQATLTAIERAERAAAVRAQTSTTEPASVPAT